MDNTINNLVIPDIINAINNGEYKLTFEEPNNIEICTARDGSEYYRIIEDDVKFGVYGGSSVVSVLDKVFYCDLGTGDWYEGEVDNGEYIDNKDLIKALENIPDILTGVMLTPDEQMEVYFRANPNAKDLPYYWWEDEDCPANMEDDEDEDEVF